MSRHPLVATPDQTLEALVETLMVPHGISFLPVVDGDVLLGYIDTSVLKKIDRENLAATHVDDVFVALARDNAIAPDMPLADVMTRIGETGRRKFLVAEGAQLLGIVTLVDLLGYLTVVQELGVYPQTHTAHHFGD